MISRKIFIKLPVTISLVGGVATMYVFLYAWTFMLKALFGKNSEAAGWTTLLLIVPIAGVSFLSSIVYYWLIVTFPGAEQYGFTKLRKFIDTVILVASSAALIYYKTHAG